MDVGKGTVRPLSAEARRSSLASRLEDDRPCRTVDMSSSCLGMLPLLRLRLASRTVYDSLRRALKSFNKLFLSSFHYVVE